MDSDQIKENHKRNVATHIRTAFIFPLAEFERLFGELWGHDIEDKNELTKEEYEWYKIYRELRKSILDNGNNQIRLSDNEIDKLYISSYPYMMRIKEG